MDDMERELLNFNEMGTSIEDLKVDRDLFKDKDNSCSTGSCNKSKKFDVNNFVEELENKLDNFDDTYEDEPMPSNSRNSDEKSQPEQDEEVIIENKTNVSNGIEYNKKILEFLIFIKEPLIVILLFILLNNKYLHKLIVSVPYMDINNYPSLIIRGIIFAGIIFFLRRFDMK